MNTVKSDGMATTGESSPQRGANLAYPEDEFATLDDSLFVQVCKLIQESHACVSTTVNAEMTELYWQVGDAINRDLLGGKRAEYGAQAVQRLAERLTRAYGRGWSAQQLRHCRHLAHTFPHDEFFSALRRKLSWTNIPRPCATARRGESIARPRVP